MKRNQAVAAIDIILCDKFFISVIDGNGAWDTHVLAEAILDRLEDLGMRPPYDASQDDGADTMEWEKE